MTDHPPVRSRAVPTLLALALLLPLAASVSRAGLESGPRPLRFEGFGADARPVLSGRTLVAAIQLDRDQARLLAVTVKERPFLAPRLAAPRHHGSGGAVQVEVALRGPGGESFTTRRDVAGLCLAHSVEESAPHIAGDTIRLHRESFLVELPELAGLDLLEVAYHDGDPAAPARVALAAEPLAASLTAPPVLANGDVIWPERCPRPSSVRYRVYGAEGETAKRINLVILPDGYTCDETLAMETDADRLVAWFRGQAPLRQHDRFFNYILVYAYSSESGTDECDCPAKSPRDTAMSTGFPESGPCESSANRCLYYDDGNPWAPGCDRPNAGETNHVAAELRAPAVDRSLIMVNTDRYGGCAGFRATYSAGYFDRAEEIAYHELAHSFTDLRLADEYGAPGCGSEASGVNTSLDPIQGAWPEFFPGLPPPVEGAYYVDQCVYRPTANCKMRELGQFFCPVCRQEWALDIFGHPRVQPTAPIEATDPGSPASAVVGVTRRFSVATRLAAGCTPDCGDLYSWTLDGQGIPGSGPSLDWMFAAPGTYTLAVELRADRSFIQPAKDGPNVDVATWTVEVTEPTCDPAPIFAGVREALDLDPCLATGIDVRWDPATFGPSGGSYTVRRDGLVVASGVSGTSYVDVPGDALDHAYRVTAVATACGAEDGNNVTASQRDLAGPVFLPALGNVLRGVKGAEVHISWADEPGAASYDVAGSDSRDFSTPALIGSAASGTVGVDDPGALQLPGLRTYRARQEACGVRSGY